MVCEGVDIPRLRVGVYATAARTELFFRQVVGRFVRRTPKPSRQMSFLLLPADPAAEARSPPPIEEERRHALALDPELEERDAPVERSPASDGFVALSSNARLDDVISLHHPPRRRPAPVRRRGEPRVRDHHDPRRRTRRGRARPPKPPSPPTSAASASATAAPISSRR